MSVKTGQGQPAQGLSASSALSLRSDTREAAREVAALLRAASPVRPDALFVFLSFQHRAFAAEALDILRSELHPAHLLASTAESVACDAQEIERKPGISALALRMPGVVANPFWFELADGPPSVWDPYLIRERVGIGADIPGPHGVLPHRATILVADPFSMHPGQVCAALDAAAGGAGARVMGGLASGANHAGLNVLAVDHHHGNDGVVGLSLFGDIDVSCTVSQGCRPIGPRFVVTKGHGNEILELGGHPALVAAQRMAEELADSERALIGQGLLVGIATDAAKSRLGRGDFLVRPVVAVDPSRGALHISDRVRVGTTVQFQLRDARTADEDMRMLLDAAMLGGTPEAALLFTCNARGAALFGSAHHDARCVSERFGGLPLSGFHCAGEIGTQGQRSFVHTQTASLVLFRAPARPAPPSAPSA